MGAVKHAVGAMLSAAQLAALAATGGDGERLARVLQGWAASGTPVHVLARIEAALRRAASAAGPFPAGCSAVAACDVKYADVLHTSREVCRTCAVKYAERGGSRGGSRELCPGAPGGLPGAASDEE